MSRVATKGAVGELFHVYNRGVDKRAIFLERADYIRFYESLDLFNNTQPVVNLSFARLQKKKQKEKLVDVVAYCLLPNHFHFILRQRTENGIGEFMKRVSGGYTSYFNEKSARNGALFQGIYKRVLIDTNKQFTYLFAYVNENYTVHHLTEPGDVMYTSSHHYSGQVQSKLLVSTAKNRAYDKAVGVALARQIYQQRQVLKHSLLE